ncbi:MAG TPA: hypothetical protein VI727_08105 [Candidatus Brocadiaceae bacterium]|nr:hypothetical protein [Candidatus Brocadiaceae bacterium]
MKIELNEESAWAVSIIAIGLATALTVSLLLSYYRLKVEKLTEIVKAGANPVVVRCALYQSCPATGLIVVEKQP